MTSRPYDSRGRAWVKWLCPYDFLHIIAVSVWSVPFKGRIGLGVMELRTLLPLIYIVIIILVSFVKSSFPSTVIEGRRLRLMREGGTRKGCPSSFSWLDRFIFAFQPPFRTSIALRPFLVAFLLLQCVSKAGASERICIYPPFPC